MSNDRLPGPRERFTATKDLRPSPAAMAAATRITLEQFQDVEQFASILDDIAEEARRNERARIFKMGFIEMWREIWRTKKIRKAQ